MNGERLPVRLQVIFVSLLNNISPLTLCSFKVGYISFSAHTDFQQTLTFVKQLKPPHMASLFLFFLGLFQCYFPHFRFWSMVRCMRWVGWRQVSWGVLKKRIFLLKFVVFVSIIFSLLFITFLLLYYCPVSAYEISASFSRWKFS